MAPPWTAGSSIWPWRSPQKAHPMSGWNSCLQKIMPHYNAFFMERSGSYMAKSKGIFYTGNHTTGDGPSMTRARHPAEWKDRSENLYRRAGRT